MEAKSRSKSKAKKIKDMSSKREKSSGGGMIFTCEFCRANLGGIAALERHMKTGSCYKSKTTEVKVGYGKDGGSCSETTEMRVRYGKDGKKTYKVDPFYASIDYTKPLKFLMDEQRGIFPVMAINDDVMTLDQCSAYYEEPLRKCGCVACCDNKRCCGAGSGGGCYKGCRCHCNDDPDNDSDYESEEDESDLLDDGGDIDQELREKYQKQLRSGECFDIDYVDYYIDRYGVLDCNGLPTRLMPSLSQYPIEFQDHIKKLPVLAIKRYNVMNPGMNYKCLQLLDVNDRFEKYYITFVAANYASTGDYLLRRPQTFQAKVGFYIEGTGRTIVRKVHFCRLKPPQS